MSAARRPWRAVCASGRTAKRRSKHDLPTPLSPMSCGSKARVSATTRVASRTSTHQELEQVVAGRQTQETTTARRTCQRQSAAVSEARQGYALLRIHTTRQPLVIRDWTLLAARLAREHKRLYMAPRGNEMRTDSSRKPGPAEWRLAQAGWQRSRARLRMQPAARRWSSR